MQGVIASLTVMVFGITLVLMLGESSIVFRMPLK